MTFLIVESKAISANQLYYLDDEQSFYMKAHSNEIDYYLVYNGLSLNVLNNILVNVSGYCPNHNWKVFTHNVPKYKKYSMYVSDVLEPGFSYTISGDVNTYFNKDTGWLCMGNPDQLGEAVEFINGCVAVLYKDNLVSLWLRPQMVTSTKLTIH